MKPFFKMLPILLLAQFFILIGCPNNGNTTQVNCDLEENKELEACIGSPSGGDIDCSNPVSCYGYLKANGNMIVGSKTGDTPVQLRGISFGWSNATWESGMYFNRTAAHGLIDGWQLEIIRVPQGVSGTTTATLNNTDGVKQVINAALEKNIYVIIDFHSHAAHLHVNQAKAFFEDMARTYGSYPNVIFEIYNEPICSNGANSCNTAAERTTWAQIKTYAEQIIPIIRQYSPNLILVGTPFYCQNVNAPVGDFLSYDNIAYVIHFYAATHKLASFSSRVDAVLTAGKPVFASEYGTVTADGGQGANLNSHDATSADAWLEFFNQRNISYCAWQVSHKNEGSSFFKTNLSSAAAGFNNTSNMTASGLYTFNKLQAWAQQSPWRNK